MKLDFWFDFSSPYAYLASTQVDALAARTGADLTWRPMLLGAVFREVGQVDVPMLAASPAKQAYYARDLERWAAWWAAPFRFPSRFPIRTVLPLRVFCANRDVAFAHRVFRAAWAEDRDVSHPAVLVELGADAADIEAAAGQKQALFDSTAAAVAAGVFGAPTFVVEGRWLFWGQDRMDMVERCLSGWTPPA